MARTSYRTALRQIHRLFDIGTIGGLTDGELLERFTSCDHEHEAAELAFAALVERHGPMVLRVCQSVLRDGHDAEDAFQASFLILVRKAASIRKHSSVASWLYGVAFRVACCQKGAAARRRRHEQRAAEKSVESADDTDRDELAAVLHEELDRLPEKYRAPLVLCNFESLSHEQAARELCWPVGTVRSRLARGREQLRSRLLRRGLAPSVVFLKQALCAQATRAAIPPELATATACAALHYASSKSLTAGVISTSVALLVEGAMNIMTLARIKSALRAERTNSDDTRTAQRASEAAISLDAVFSQYERAKVSNKELAVVQLSRKNELARIASEAQQEAELMDKFVAGSEDYKKHENKVTQLKAQHEAGRLGGEAQPPTN